MLSNHPSVLGSGAAGVTTPAAASAALDLISTTQGAVLYRDATEWTALTPGTAGQLLSTQGAAADPIWVSATGGAGDVNGPASSTDNAIVRFDGAGGKTIQNSAVTIADTTGAMTWASGQSATLTADAGSGASLVLGAGADGVPRVRNQTISSIDIAGFSALTPNKSTNASWGSGAYYPFGVAETSNNAGIFQFGYVGAGSTSNAFGMGIFGQSAALWITGNGNALIGTTTDITGAGGVYAANGFEAPNNVAVRLRNSGGTAINALKMSTSNNLEIVAGGGGDVMLYGNGGTVGANGVKVMNTTASTGLGTGALQVAGGIYAGAASVFNSPITVGSTYPITLGVTGAARATFTGVVNDGIKLAAQASGTYGTANTASWYLADGTTRRAYLGYVAANDQNFDIGTTEAGGIVRLYSGNGTLTQTLSNGAATFAGLVFPQQATTAGAPAYVKGAIYFDTTLNKLRVGGATAWETITSV